jgi:hypothetical protein
MHAGLGKEGEMSIRTQAPIGDEHISCLQAWMDRLHQGQIMGEEGRGHWLQEESGASMEQPQQVRHGNAAPRPLLCRLAERVLEGRRIRHRACRAINEKSPMPRPAPVVHGGSLHGAVEVLQEEVKEAQWEPDTGLAVC